MMKITKKAPEVRRIHVRYRVLIPWEPLAPAWRQAGKLDARPETFQYNSNEDAPGFWFYLDSTGSFQDATTAASPTLTFAASAEYAVRAQKGRVPRNQPMVLAGDERQAQCSVQNTPVVTCDVSGQASRSNLGSHVRTNCV